MTFSQFAAERGVTFYDHLFLAPTATKTKQGQEKRQQNPPLQGHEARWVAEQEVDGEAEVVRD